MGKPSADPSSGSEVLRANSIFVLKLDDVHAGPWTGGPAVESRDVAMRVELSDICKGTLRQKVRHTFELKIQQRGSQTGIVMDYYGLWSHASLAVGSQLLAFCPGADEDVTKLLDDGPCEQLLEPPEPALADARAAMELEHTGARPDDVLAAAAKQVAARQDYFARYVWARAGGAALAEPEKFEAVMRLVDGRATPPRARQSYVSSVYDTLSNVEPAPAVPLRRFARALCQLLSLAEAAPMKVNVEQVYLPNLLRLSGAPRDTAEHVFAGHEAERPAALAALDTHASPLLRAWLAAPSPGQPKR